MLETSPDLLDALRDIRAVLLDAGGVLVLPDPAVLRGALKDLDAEPDDALCHRAHYEGMHELDVLGRLDWATVDRHIARLLGVPENRQTEARAVLEDVYLHQPWVPVDGAAEALRSLQAAGLALAVVSNATGTMEEQLARHEICSVHGGAMARVEVVIDSDVVGIEKPDPRIFGLALERLGIQPDQGVYVGDTVHFDVTGARAAGLTPIHVDPYRLCAHSDHAHAASVDAVAAAVAHGAVTRR